MERIPKQPIHPPFPSVRDVSTSGRSAHFRPTALGGQVRAHFVGPVIVVDVAGRLSDVLDALDRAIRLALAGDPRGVVCDLSRVIEVSAPGALGGLALNGRHPRDWPGVPLAIAGLGQRGSERLVLKPMAGHLMVNSSLREALSMVLQSSLPAVRSLQLAPHPTAPRASRDFVSRALLDLRLGRLVPAACLVVSELVTNAMTHTGTDIDLTVSEHRQAIRIAVRDHGPDLPVDRAGTSHEHGRGLSVVAGLSSAWGVLPHADGGKVVWAVISAATRTSQPTDRLRSIPVVRRELALR